MDTLNTLYFNTLSPSLKASYSMDIHFLNWDFCLISLQIMASPIVHNFLKYVYFKESNQQWNRPVV
jgi:hypothetical protein